MVDAAWLAFLPIALLIIATPGQDMLLVMSRAVTQGTGAGLATATGVSVGLLGHTLLATAGLGAILQVSAWLFVALKLAGAAWLVYLGIQMLSTRDKAPAVEGHPPRSSARLFADGALSNLLNPKIAIFYFAFLPQFVTPESAAPTLAILVLGAAFALLTFIVKGPVALFAGALSGWLRARPSALAWMHRTSGAVLIALGLRLAFTERPA